MTFRSTIAAAAMLAAHPVHLRANVGDPAASLRLANFAPILPIQK